MRIKLVAPRSTRRVMDTAFKTHVAPPLSLLVLAALMGAEHRVTLEDENVERLRLDDRPDLVGVTVKVDTFDRAGEISKRYRARGVPVVWGGIHPTVCPEHCGAHADAVAIGDGETVWCEIVRDAELGRLKDFYRAAPCDLVVTQVPRWELLRGKNYLFTNTLVMSRGCRWRCDFCYGSSPNLAPGHRVKPVGRVLTV